MVTFDHYPTAADILAIQGTGAQARPFRALPMIAVRGTSLQVCSLPALPGLRSIYFNRRLTYFLDESVPLIGAPRVWNELGYTGKGVTVAVIDSAAASGTSMATPHVSGTVALMLEANPALTPQQVRSVLESTATPMPDFQRHEVGAGYLNTLEAVKAVRP